MLVIAEREERETTNAEDVVDWNVFCDGDDEGYLRLDSFFDCFWCLVGGDVDSCCVWLEFLHCLILD